jgi:hypothetical protein
VSILVSEIQRAVARNFRVPEELFFSPSRQRNATRARHIAMFLSRELTPHSLPALGGFFRRDHSTVLHGICEAGKRIDADPRLAQKIESIRYVLRANGTLSKFERSLARIDDPSARKTVIMSKWERGDISSAQAKHLIRAGGLEAA